MPAALPLVLLLLSVDFDSLKASPGVESVREVIAGEPAIIHIRDWHFVGEEAFAIDTGLTGDELKGAYAAHQQTVQKVIESQRRILSQFEEVFAEGISDENEFIFRAQLRVFRREGPTENDLLRLGATGQLALERKLRVKPAEGPGFETANPVKDGAIEFDEHANEKREDEIVRRLAKGGVVILGGDHDLSDNIKRLKLDVGYVVVTPHGYPKR